MTKPNKSICNDCKNYLKCCGNCCHPCGECITHFSDEKEEIKLVSASIPIPNKDYSMNGISKKIRNCVGFY